MITLTLAQTAVAIILLLGVCGFIFGLILAIANKKFAVERDPRIHEVEDILPKGQCGACGFAGCQAYAEAVVTRPEVAPNLCAPGKTAVAEKVAELTGKKAEKVEPRVAHIRCANPIKVAHQKYKYSGVNDCIAASILHLGPKDCQYGCIGFGTCEHACPFGAIKLGENGLPIVDRKKCTGCGKCIMACPKKIIELIPVGAKVAVNCASRDKGGIARKKCPMPCLGCGLCLKQCTHGAIKVENNLAVVNPAICVAECDDPTCLAKCPTGAIQALLNKVNL